MPELDADGSALLRAILADPADHVVRLVYADWLQANGDPERAEFIRRQIANAEWVWAWSDRSGPRPEWDQIYGPPGTAVLLNRILPPANMFWGPSHRFPGRQGGIRAAVECHGTVLVVRNGFAGAVTCTYADWVHNVDALFWHSGQTDESGVARPVPATAQPIDRVTFLTPPIFEAQSVAGGPAVRFRFQGRSQWRVVPFYDEAAMRSAEWPGIRFNL